MILDAVTGATYAPQHYLLCVFLLLLVFLVLVLVLVLDMILVLVLVLDMILVLALVLVSVLLFILLVPVVYVLCSCSCSYFLFPRTPRDPFPHAHINDIPANRPWGRGGDKNIPQIHHLRRGVSRDSLS